MVPPLTDDNAADGKLGIAVTIVTVRMEYYITRFNLPPF